MVVPTRGGRTGSVATARFREVELAISQTLGSALHRRSLDTQGSIDAAQACDQVGDLLATTQATSAARKPARQLGLRRPFDDAARAGQHVDAILLTCLRAAVADGSQLVSRSDQPLCQQKACS